MSVIEVNLLSDFNIDENYENIQLRIKIIRGKICLRLGTT